MRIETAIATMNLSNHRFLIRKMNVQGNSITVNQGDITSNTQRLSEKNTKHALFSYHERGLSRSRNRALENTKADILIVADDDLQYVDGYVEIVEAGFKKYPDADIIAFRVDDHEGNVSHAYKPGRINIFSAMKLSSVQLSFRVASFKKLNIHFDESFGAGTENYMGEESILLIRAIKKGLRVYSHPIKIAQLTAGESTWFNGYTEKYFYVKGRAFKAMFPLLSPIIALRFVIVKYPLYKNDIKPWGALRNILSGIHG